MKGSQQPWDLAAEAGRDYLTPEDVAAAVVNGASRRALMTAVLIAIEAKRAEDATLCAFIALYKLREGEYKTRRTPWLITTSASPPKEGA